MLLYKENNDLITKAQYEDPLLNHLFNKIENNLGDGKGKNFLDIGCGPGRLTIAATKRGYKSTGIDIEKKVLQIANKEAKKQGLEKNVNFLKKDLLKEDTLNERYDVVVCSEVIEHLLSPSLMIKKISDLLKTNGLLILTTPHGNNQWTVLDDYGEHLKRFDEDEIRNLLEKYKIFSLITIGFPCFRSFCFIYNLIVKKCGLSHGSKWRNNSKVSKAYYFLVTLLLKIDEVFNSYKKGTNFILIARKI